MEYSRRRITILTLFTMLTFSVLTFAQKTEVIDPLALFDKDKVWYNGFTETWFQFFGIPDSDVRNSIEHWERIGHEPVESGRTISGMYGTGGETHGSYMRWSERSGFVWLDVNKCMGGPMRIMRGRAEVVSGGVVFYPEIRLGDSEGHSGHGQHSKQLDRIDLISITWMRSTFLVPKDQLQDFSDYTAGLGEYNGNFIYMFDIPFFAKSDAGPESEPATFQLPVYPAGYERYLKRPVRGPIISIGRGLRRLNKDSDTYDELVTPVKVRVDNAGNSKVGLMLHAVGEEQGFTESFEVRAVKGNMATIQNVRWIPKKNCVVSAADDCKTSDHVRLRNGLVLSSNGY